MPDNNNDNVEYLPLGPSSPKQQKAVEAFEQVQILVLGGAMFGGKSFLAAMLSTLYADDPMSRIAVFRTTLEQMKRGGSIIDTFKSVYKLVADRCKMEIGGNPPVGKIISGPGAGDKRGDGAKIDFIPLQHEKDIENIRGAAFSLAIVEEAIPDRTQDQIEFIMSRLRSEAKRESKMIITCNPDPWHYICSLIKDYYLDEDGYPIEERCGDVRYFYKHGGEYYWGSTREEIMENLDLPEEEKEFILSFSFVQLTAFDNPIGMKLNPTYMSYLKGLDEVKKQRYLYGCWFAEAEGQGVFQRAWLRGPNGTKVKTIKDIPKGCVAVRGVDKAYTECSEVNPYPDFTAFSPLVLKDRDGFFWLVGNFHPNITDEVPYRKSEVPVLGRFRKLAGARDNLITLQMRTDQENAEVFGYQEPQIVLAKDSGGGSGMDYYSTISRMGEEGIKVIKDQTVSNVKGKKMADFLGFTSMCEQGMVYIVEETFDRNTLEAWYKELETFDGSPSTKTRKDDFVDSMSMAFNAIKTMRKPYQTLVRNQNVVDTLSANLFKGKQ